MKHYPGKTKTGMPLGKSKPKAQGGHSSSPRPSTKTRKTSAQTKQN